MILKLSLSLPLAAVVLSIAMQAPCFAETGAETGSTAAKPQTWTFRNRLSIVTSDLKHDYSITQGDSDQDEIASFALNEKSKETLLVGVTKMDTLIKTPEQAPSVADDMKTRMKKNYPDITVDVSATTVETKTGKISATRMTFSEPIDGKDVYIYLFCVSSNDGRVHYSYAIQINVAPERALSDGLALVKTFVFTKPSDSTEPATEPAAPAK